MWLRSYAHQINIIFISFSSMGLFPMCFKMSQQHISVDIRNAAHWGQTTAHYCLRRNYILINSQKGRSRHFSVFLTGGCFQTNSSNLSCKKSETWKVQKMIVYFRQGLSRKRISKFSEIICYNLAQTVPLGRKWLHIKIVLIFVM